MNFSLAPADCTSTANQVGPAGGQELTPTATQGVSTATSAGDDTSGKTPGRYCFFATWAGDSNYTSGASGGAAATECFAIAKLPSTTVTTSNPTGDTHPRCERDRHGDCVRLGTDPDRLDVDLLPVPAE